MKLAVRTYRQGARAEAAEATGIRILDAFTERLQNGWFDEITLEEVARAAEVSVQTVIRRFGGKEGLLEAAHERFGAAIRARRQTPARDPGAIIDALIDDYEQIGDLIMRVLAQEDRYPPLKKVSDVGRASHRAWIGEHFSRWLDRLDEPARTAAHDALVVATDIYVWKLVRRDFGRSTDELAATIRRLAAAALGASESEIFNGSSEGKV
jgi:AcrR family transcriptional regulator